MSNLTILGAKNLEIKQRRFIESFVKNMGNITKTCKTIGISRQTFYDWQKNSELFKKVVDEVNHVLLDFAEGQLFELMKDKNPSAVIFYLKTKGKQRGYQQSANIDHTNSDGSLNRRILQVNPISNDVQDAEIIED